jgi:deoxyribose-phosphate aldolase
LSAGADFLKTSTGFSTGGATADDITLMRGVAGNRAGVKASGGVRSLADATTMLKAGASRIGASASVRIVAELAGQAQEHAAATGY